MNDYPFAILDEIQQQHTASGVELLARRSRQKRELSADAVRFVPDDALKTAIHTALAVGEPLLLTGEPGTGKTQTAYYVAQQLGLGKVLHFQAKSGSTARDLLYRFDNIAYFREASLSNQANTAAPNKKDFIEHGELWQALSSDTPRVLLIDEIDKAPRDFPNDLLHELDQMRFKVPELRQQDKDFEVTAAANAQPLIFITSNSERRLPEAFLRRCVFHHIAFNNALLNEIIDAHSDDFSELSDDLLDRAAERFVRLRNDNLRKVPATGEFLVWLRVMALAVKSDPNRLHILLAQLEDDDQLPHIGVLLKDHQDLQEHCSV